MSDTVKEDNEDNLQTSAIQIAEHYNSKNETGLEARAKSRIFYMRNFNNWIKSVLINIFVSKTNEKQRYNYRPTVLDLGCGRGGDIQKWRKANVFRITFADIAEISLDECKRRCQEKNVPFITNFIHLDATKDLIKDKYTSERDIRYNNQYHDLVSSQFVIHYSFESYKQADTFLRNVSDSLKTGGYFIGTTTNAHEVIKRLRESEDNSFGNEIYKIKFHQEDKDNLDLFGVKFDFQLDNVVECPEFLLNFEVLIKIAEKHNLKLVMRKTFAEFFTEYSDKEEYKYLIGIMQALQPYYPKNRINQDEELKEEEYEFIKSKLEDEKFKNEIKENEVYATLSKSEWEAITLYLVFAFEKVENYEKLETVEKEKKVETVENDEKVETVETVENDEKVETVETVETVENDEKVETVENDENDETNGKDEKVEKKKNDEEDEEIEPSKKKRKSS